MTVISSRIWEIAALHTAIKAKALISLTQAACCLSANWVNTFQVRDDKWGRACALILSRIKSFNIHSSAAEMSHSENVGEGDRPLYWDEAAELSQYCCFSATHSTAVQIFFSGGKKYLLTRENAPKLHSVKVTGIIRMSRAGWASSLAVASKSAVHFLTCSLHETFGTPHLVCNHYNDLVRLINYLILNNFKSAYVQLLSLISTNFIIWPEWKLSIWYSEGESASHLVS